MLENGYQNETWSYIMKLVSMNQRHRRDKCGVTDERYCVQLLLGSNPGMSFQNGEI
jgi:hypothetical protein